MTAFVGATRLGPVNVPKTVDAFAEFESEFGGLDSGTVLSYAVHQFFLNGGSRAVIVRTASRDELYKAGLQVLRDVDVNLLCLPDLAASRVSDVERVAVITAAEEFCKAKRMLLILDSPATWTTVDIAQAGLTTYDSVRSDHAAMYFPHIDVVDPQTNQARSIPPSGAVAGVMARMDCERDVWHPAAGLIGVHGLTVAITDSECDLLNSLAVNSIREFPNGGPVIWGARIFGRVDAVASDWKYVPVHRLNSLIEESVWRGLQWVVFEPNDELLWSQIRRTVEDFLDSLFRRGVFQGTARAQAYFVRVDRTTTSHTDIDNGIVNVSMGFALLRPAEFVTTLVQLSAGRIRE